MFTTIRKHQRWLMLVIAFLTIVAFAFLYNTTDLDRVGANMVAKIYGRNVMQVDIERALRNYQLALALGQLQLVQDLAGRARTEDEAAENFIWNLMVLQHEAAALGVEPGMQTVVDRIKTMPVFQSGKAFDPVKYSAFVQEQLAPRGFTERQLEQVVKDALRLEGIKSLVESPAAMLQDEIRPILDRIAPADVMVIRFDAPPAAKAKDDDKARVDAKDKPKAKSKGKGKAKAKDEVKAGAEAAKADAKAGESAADEKSGDTGVSEADLAAAFEARKESLQLPEKRSVRYAAFTLSKTERDLKDKARIEALQRLSTSTGDFAQAVADGGKPLSEAARAKGVEVGTTPLFAKDGSVAGALSGLDGEVVPAAAAVAFRLPPGGGIEIVQLGEDGYAVIEVAEVQAARPLTLDEARDDLQKAIVAARREQAVKEAADKALASIRSQMASGTSFADAAKVAGVKVEAINGLTVFAEDMPPERREVAMAAMDKPVGTLGDFIPSPGGGFAVYIASRGEPDAAKLAQQMPMIQQGILQQKKMLMFAQWLQVARQASGLQILRGAR